MQFGMKQFISRSLELLGNTAVARYQYVACHSINKYLKPSTTAIRYSYIWSRCCGIRSGHVRLIGNNKLNVNDRVYL